MGTNKLRLSPSSPAFLSNDYIRLFAVQTRQTKLEQSVYYKLNLSRMQNTNWHDIDYLRTGSVHQRAAYLILSQHAILPRLAEFDPVLVGTFPLDITARGSDLDIICEVYEGENFLKTVDERFGQYNQNVSYRTAIGGVNSAVTRFWVEGYEVEIFGQPIPTKQQNGYKHLVVEACLLDLGEATFRENVIRAKREGVKTEPAFANLLRLSGNPYQSILRIESMSDET